MQTARLQTAVLCGATPLAATRQPSSSPARFTRGQDPDKTPPSKPRPWDGRREAASAQQSQAGGKPASLQLPEVARAGRAKPLPGGSLQPGTAVPGGEAEAGGGRRPGFRSSRFTKEGGKKGGTGEGERSRVGELRE